jgi:hypothetical protein
MPPIPSKAAMQLVKQITSVCSSTLGLTVTHQAATFFANQIDVAADLANAGAKITPEKLTLIFAQKTLSMGALATDQNVKCVAAMAAFGLNLGQFGIEVVAASEVPILGREAFVQAYSVVSAFIGAQRACAPVVRKLRVEATDGAMELEYSLSRWIQSGQLGLAD